MSKKLKFEGDWAYLWQKFVCWGNPGKNPVNNKEI